MLLKNAIVISIFLAIFFLVDGRKRFESGMRGPAFLTTEKKSPFLKNIRICVEVALVLNLFTGSRLFRR